MFIGEYQHSIDDKSRVAIPVKFRNRLADGCVVTRGLDKCLWIYPVSEWGKIASGVSELPITSKNARSFARFILSGAVDCKLDKVGRVNLPSYLKEYAGIKNKISICGVYNRIEIWPEDSWNGFKKTMEESSDEVAEKIEELGF